MMTSSGIQNSDRERFAADIRYIAIKNMVVTFSTAHVKNAADFLKNKELKLGIVRSFKYGKEADAFLEKIQSEGRIRAESDIDRVFQLLARGQVDAVLANHTAVPAYISTYHLEARAIVQDWFPADLPIPHSLMLSRKDFDEREVSKWRAIVRGMRVDGTLQKMFEHHLGPLAAKNLMQFVPNDSN